MPEVIKNVREKINNTKLVDEFKAIGGKILHFNGKRRSMTVAFIPKNGRVEIATAITHRNDTFTKKIGTKLAIENFHEGKIINLPFCSRRHITRDLQTSLNFLVY